jgi:hypothetical protein
MRNIGRRIAIQGQARAKTKDPIQKTTKSKKRTGSMSQVVECLTQCNALNTTPIPRILNK